MKTIAWTHEARRALRKLPPNVRADIETKIARFAETGAGNVKRLTGGRAPGCGPATGA